ncbi:hypothetical protein FACS1894205_6930 [Alphaproteobacteria bacterium]|nr:hypothetical protein FACS1894205_6930 [Alphaproteobacteria bacterium]
MKKAFGLSILLCLASCLTACAERENPYIFSYLKEGRFVVQKKIGADLYDAPREDVLAEVKKDPDGVLYSEIFYIVATPDDVREAIAGRRLEKERKVVRYTVRGSVRGRIFNSAEERERYISPLSVAVGYTPHPEVVDILVAAGCNVNEILPDMDRDAPFPEGGYQGLVLETAFSINPYPGVLAALFRYNPSQDAKETLLASVLWEDDKHFAALDLLVKSGINLNGRVNGTFFTPLAWAVFYNQTRLVTILLEYGADPNATVKGGRWPLWHAMSERNYPMMLLLMDNGADPKIRHGHWSLLAAMVNDSPFHKKGDKEYFKALDRVVAAHPKGHKYLEEVLEELRRDKGRTGDEILAVFRGRGYKI